MSASHDRKFFDTFMLVLGILLGITIGWRKMRAASRKAGRMGARNCGSVERRPADPA